MQLHLTLLHVLMVLLVLLSLRMLQYILHIMFALDFLRIVGSAPVAAIPLGRIAPQRKRCRSCVSPPAFFGGPVSVRRLHALARSA